MGVGRLYSARISAGGRRVARRLSATADWASRGQATRSEPSRGVPLSALWQSQVARRQVSALWGGGLHCSSELESHRSGMPAAAPVNFALSVSDVQQVTMPPRVSAPPFVHDVLAGPMRTVEVPSGLKIHLDFEAGKGKYGKHLAGKLKDTHVVTINDSELAFLSYLKGATADAGALACLWDQIMTAWHDLRRGQVTAAVRTYFIWERKVINELVTRQVDREQIAAPESEDYPDDEEFIEALLEQFKRSAQIECEILGTKSPIHDRFEDWFNFMIAGLRDATWTPPLLPETVFQLLQEIALELFYQNYCTFGVPDNNMTIIRSPMRAVRGFTRIPLPDARVDSITWIAPFQHAEDYGLVTEEFRRILRPDWKMVAIAVVKYPERESNPNFSLAAAEIMAQKLGGVLNTDPKVAPELPGSDFPDLRMVAYYLISRVDPSMSPDDWLERKFVALKRE